MSNALYDKEISKQQKNVASIKDMRLQMEVLLKTLDPQLGESILDVGSGNGLLVGQVVERVGSAGKAFGIDASGAMVEMASEQVPAASFQQADATKLPFEDAIFDAVVCSQLMCFITDVDTALDEVFRVLKPNGRFVVLDTDWGTMVWNTKDPELLKVVMSLLKQGYHTDSLPRTLSKKLKHAGFEVCDFFAHPIVSLEPKTDSYAEQMSGFVRPLLEKHPKFPADLADKWEADRNAVIADGEYFFSINRFIFSAQKRPK